jgi:hypothetical protein
VWIDLTVDGTAMSPRLRVTDVPVHVAPEVKRIFVAGTGFSTAGATIAPSGTVSATGLTFGTGTGEERIFRLPIAAPGEFPGGARVDLEIGFELLTGDADITFHVADAGGQRFCAMRALDQNGLTLYTGVPGTYPGTAGQERAVGSTEGASNNFLSLQGTWILPASGVGYVRADVESTSLAGSCVANVPAQDGLFFDVTRNNSTERYRLQSVHLTLSPL